MNNYTFPTKKDLNYHTVAQLKILLREVRLVENNIFNELLERNTK